MELKISVLSKAGQRAVNEDAYGCWSNQGTCICVVSDGAGGHNGGEIASKLAVGQVLEWFQQYPECSAESIAEAVAAANTAIVDAQRQSPQYGEMRATIVVLAIDSERGVAIWGHLGDSRLYCFRQRRIVLQTRDHSVMQSMVDCGYMRLEDLRVAPQRGVLLAALGDVETFAPSIEASVFPLCDGDVFLLCTDGFWEHVNESQMEGALGEADSPELWLRQLEHHLVAKGDDEQDNYSALVVACNGQTHAPGLDLKYPPAI